MSESKLFAIRTKKGLSLAALAKILVPKTTPTQIMRLETGERKLTQKWVKRLAAALGVSEYDLYEDSDMIVSAPEREMIETLRKLPQAQRDAIMETVATLSAKIGGEDDDTEDA